MKTKVGFNTLFDPEGFNTLFWWPDKFYNDPGYYCLQISLFFFFKFDIIKRPDFLRLNFTVRELYILYTSGFGWVRVLDILI